VTRGLVLGGGGLVGLAWGIGWLDGLANADVTLAGADRVVGTSAGAALATMLEDPGRTRFAQLLQLAPTVGDPEDPPEALRLALELEDPTEAALRRIGAAALAARTMPAAQWRGLVGMLAGGLADRWPAGTAIVVRDAETGERIVLREGDAPILDAFAASAAVPGILPPIEVAGRRCIDGGIASITNADVAADLDRVLVVRLLPPMPGGPHANRPERLEEELAGVADALVVEPHELPEGWLMDPRLVSPAYTAGYWQGKDGADPVRAFWRG
jgi:NTE family protein